MKTTSRLSHVRNIGVVAHVDAGKTTLTERLLYYSGASHKIGEVHDGAAHMDYLAEEQRHGITITAALTRAPWREHQLQLIDTPGHVDFTIEVERSMRVLDGCVLVLDGVRGVEPQSETVWRQRSRFNLPALVFINKMDRPGADFTRALEAVRARLHVEPAPLTLPLPERGAVIDLLDRRLLRFAGEQGEQLLAEPCPEDLWVEAAPLRETLLLAAAEFDESLADQVLAGVEPEVESIRAALRLGALSGRLCPCYGGSALRNLGVQPLLDGILDYLPAPSERPSACALRPDGTQETVPFDENGPLLALAFKVQLWEGRRHVFARLYRGTLRAGDAVEFLDAEGRLRSEHVARLFDVDAGKKIRLDEARAGDIVLLAGLRHAATGDSLCAPGAPLVLERIEARAPVLGLAIEPLHGHEEEKLLDALAKLQEEDPTLHLLDDPDTGQRVLRGMGELHLGMVVERLEREFGLGVRVGAPAVAVRETIRRAARAEVLFAPPALAEVRHGTAPMARVAVRLEPLARGAGEVLDWEGASVLPEGAALSPEQRQGLERGLRGGLEAGPLEGAPVRDLRVAVEQVELFGGASTSEALSAAAARALREALLAADPATMHPLMSLEVVVPEGAFGAVLGDLQARQALIRATRAEAGDVTIEAEAALESLLGYATRLRGLTQGRGQFSMTFARFDL